MNYSLNLNDSTLIMDLLNMSTAVNKTGQMNVEAACIFLQKAVMLIDSKFDVVFFYLSRKNNLK